MGLQPLLHGQRFLVQYLTNGIAHIEGCSGISQREYVVLVGQFGSEMAEVNFFYQTTTYAWINITLLYFYYVTGPCFFFIKSLGLQQF
jgi:hypothetical protein